MSDDQSTSEQSARKSRASRIALALFAFTARSLQQVATFVITLLAARFLLPAEYGIYAIAIVFITLIQTMTYSGYYQYIVNAKAEDKAVLGTAFWMIVGLATGASLLLSAAAQPLAWAFKAPDLLGVLIALAVIQPIAASGAWFSAALLRRGAINRHFTIIFVQNLTALIGGVILLWQWQSIYALVAYRYLRVLTAPILYLFLSSDRPGWVFDFSLAKHATRFSGGLYGARILNFLSRYAGDLLLGLMFTTAEAGLYRFGNRVASGATDIVAQPMRSFALTQFGAAARKEADLSDPLQRFVGSVVLLTGIVASIVIVFAPKVIEDYFNPAYLGALGVAYAMAIRSVLNVGTLVIEPALAARDRTGMVAMFNLFWTIVTILSVFAAAPFGLIALAASQAGVMLLTTLSAFVVLRREGIETGDAVYTFCVASTLAVAYGLALYHIWQVVRVSVDSGFWAIAAGLGLATVLGAVCLVIGTKVRAFTLSVFSG